MYDVAKERSTVLREVMSMWVEDEEEGEIGGPGEEAVYVRRRAWPCGNGQVTQLRGRHLVLSSPGIAVSEMKRGRTRSCLALPGAHPRDEVIFISAVRSSRCDPLNMGSRTCHTRRAYHHEASSTNDREMLGMTITDWTGGEGSLVGHVSPRDGKSTLR